jgi:Domain of unknown function (DUF6089)
MSLLPGFFHFLNNCPMKRVTPPVILFALVMSFSADLFAQNNPKYEFGINLGFTVYQGDLTPEQLGSFKTQQPALGLQAAKLLSSTFSVRAAFLRSRLRGDDGLYANPEFRQQRNFNFSTPVTEFTGQLVWNPLGRNYAEKGFSPYFFAGAGLAFLRIRRDWSGLNSSYFDSETSTLFSGLAADTLHSVPRLIPVIPVGMGIKYFFTPKLGMNAEAAYRLGYTDYLDGFSEAANPDKKDHYLNYSVGIIYRTGKKNRLDCPKIRY